MRKASVSPCTGHTSEALGSPRLFWLRPANQSSSICRQSPWQAPCSTAVVSEGMTCSKALPAQSTGGAPANCRTRASRIESVGRRARLASCCGHWSQLARVKMMYYGHAGACRTGPPRTACTGDLQPRMPARCHLLGRGNLAHRVQVHCQGSERSTAPGAEHATAGSAGAVHGGSSSSSAGAYVCCAAACTMHRAGKYIPSPQSQLRGMRTAWQPGVAKIV